MTARQLILLVLQASIVGTVFGFGLAASVADVIFALRRPWLLARSIVAVYVLMPVVAITLVRWFAFPQTTEIALVALSMCPVPPLLPARQERAGGNMSFALGLMVVLSFLAIVTVPLTAAILERGSARSLDITPALVVPVVMKAALLPLAAGLIVSTFWPVVAKRLRRPVGIVANLLLVLGILAIMAGSLSAMWAAVGNGTLLALTIFVAAGLAIGHVMGGPNPDDAVVLALSTACRQPALAVALATAAFPDRRFGVTILLYLLVSIVAALPYLKWQRGRMPASRAV